MKYFILFVFTGLFFLNVKVQAQTASATWALTTDGTPVKVGNIAAGIIDTATLTATGFAGHSFQSTSPAGLVLGATGPTNYPGDGTTTTANSTFTGLSTGTIRYVQFTISPAAGYNLQINNMSLQACQNAVSNRMCVAVGYSTDGTNFITFNTYGTSGDTLSGTAGTFTTFSVAPSSLTVPNGSTLTLRMIIWRKATSAATNTAVIVANTVISGFTTPVSSIGNEGLPAPKNLELSQNYPNPFNPTTVINYQMLTAGNVTIGIYSLTGQLIKILAEGYQEAGNHSLNVSGAGLSSGTYFYRINSNGFFQTKKMTLLK